MISQLLWGDETRVWRHDKGNFIKKSRSPASCFPNTRPEFLSSTGAADAIKIMSRVGNRMHGSVAAWTTVGVESRKQMRALLYFQRQRRRQVNTKNAHSRAHQAVRSKHQRPKCKSGERATRAERISQSATNPARASLSNYKRLIFPHDTQNRRDWSRTGSPVSVIFRKTYHVSNGEARR
jgi:hypothetical protein